MGTPLALLLIDGRLSTSKNVTHDLYGDPSKQPKHGGFGAQAPP